MMPPLPYSYAVQINNILNVIVSEKKTQHSARLRTVDGVHGILPFGNRYRAIEHDIL